MTPKNLLHPPLFLPNIMREQGKLIQEAFPPKGRLPSKGGGPSLVKKQEVSCEGFGTYF